MSSLSVTSPTAAVASTPVQAPARAADGDLATAGKGPVKDGDGDDKARGTVKAAPLTAAATSTSGVHNAVANLQKGG